MALEVTSFTELDESQVLQAEELLAQMLSEQLSGIDPKRGVLKELLLHFNAVFQEKNREELDRLRRSGSLLEITQDPSLAEDDAVDRIASNYGVTRNEGSKATGSVKVIIDRLQPITIAQGSIWEADGKQFIAPEAFAAKTSSANVVASSDRVLTPVGDGTYYFLIDLEAVEVGEASALKRDTTVVPQEPPLYFVTARAADDFTGGVDQETNEELISRLQMGIACKGLSGSLNMSAALRDEEEFADVIADSVIGYGDAEMLRDQHSLFPGSYGGRVDWYVRTQKRPQRLGLTKTATLVEKTSDGYGIWQFGISRDEAAAFYDVLSILPSGGSGLSGSYAVTEDIRSADMTSLANDGFLPDIQDAIEAVYSRFQAAVIRFKDTDTTTAGLTENVSTQDYDVVVRRLPLIAEIQDWVSGRGVRNRAGDVLIKAPIPCFLRISFSVELKPGTTEPDTDQIKTDIAELVNTYGFTGRLPASAISDVVHNSLSGIQYLSAIDILGDIRMPDGTVRRVRTSETLVVPDEPGTMTTARTVAFFVDPEDIAISVVTADIPEI